MPPSTSQHSTIPIHVCLTLFDETLFILAPMEDHLAFASRESNVLSKECSPIEVLPLHLSLVPMALTFNLESSDYRELKQLSSHVLRTELQRRDEEISKPACGSGARRGSYNISLHVAALFMILILSTLGMPFLSIHWCSIDALFSLLISHHCQAFSQAPYPTSLPLHLKTFWHWCPDRNGIRPPATHGFRISDRPMSSLLLEQRLPCHGRSHRHDVGVSCCHN